MSSTNKGSPEEHGEPVENRMIPPENGLDSSYERSVNGDMSMSPFTTGAATAAPPTALDPFAALTQSFAPKRAVSYLRVSTREQAERGGREEGFSIPAQRDANKKKAQSMGAMVVKEFVERGVSGTSTNRPALKEMLRYLEEEGEQIDYVIVHKLDRLARNRADDVKLNSKFQQHNIRLVSTSENIDQTPGGMLLHGIMSSIAEFYSRNLANEVLKGMNEKVKAGGSVSRAPLGYLNVRTFENGAEARTIAVDKKRADLVRWAFETYARDGWTVKTLAEELNRRGLTTVPTPKMAEGPVGARQLHNILSNPFYTGVVTFKGVQYPGKHSPLIDKITFDTVQTIMGSRLSGERSRKHAHYLKSTLFCGHCDSRLMIQKTKASKSGERYEYFSCTGRHARRTRCNLRSIQVSVAEQLIERLYRRISVNAAFLDRFASLLRRDLKELQLKDDEERASLETTKQTIERKQQKLLEAHYNEAISVEVLKKEQAKLEGEMTSVRRKLEPHLAAKKKGDTVIDLALEISRDLADNYRKAPGNVRRLMNQVFFERVLVHYEEEDGSWHAIPEYASAFAFLGADGFRTAISNSSEFEENDYQVIGSIKSTLGTQTKKSNAPLHQAEGHLDLTDMNLIQCPIISIKSTVVDLRGFEPLTPCMPCRCATNCATDPWKSEECSPDNSSTLPHGPGADANRAIPGVPRMCRYSSPPAASALATAGTSIMPVMSITGLSCQRRSSW